MAKTMKSLVGDVAWWWGRRWRQPPALIVTRQVDLAKARKSHRPTRSIEADIKRLRTEFLRAELRGVKEARTT